MEYKKFDYNTFKLYTVKTDQFKNCHMEIIFRDTAKKSDLPYLAFLTDMLAHSSKNYSKRKDMVIRLEELYQSYFFGCASKIGGMCSASFVLDFLDPNYIQEKDYLSEILSFPFEVLENPNVKDNEFDLRSFEIIKERLLNDIKSNNENPTNIALREALKRMDEESISAASILGTAKEIEAITPKNLYAFYKKMIDTYTCDIYIIGNLDMEEVANLIEKNIHIKSIKQKEISILLYPQAHRKKEEEQESNFSQSQLIMGYNLMGLSDTERHIVLPIYNEILCGSSLTSKLYTYLREENSLCYNVRTIVQKYDNLYMIVVGLAIENKKLAVSLIKKAIKEMEKGKFTLEEFENAKKALLFSVSISKESQSKIISNYLFHNLTKVPLLEEFKEKIEEVSFEEVVALSKKMKESITFTLKEGSHGKN